VTVYHLNTLVLKNMNTNKQVSSIGVVVIGRNEGIRLYRCLESLSGLGCNIVYVDSGSSDGSVDFAKKKGTIVVELSTETPFTAARARNEGFSQIKKMNPDIEFVQFVDGDCELNYNWLHVASQFLEAYPKYGVVCGRLREREPNASIYNRLCDIEWDGPIGDVSSSGGIFMIRAKAFSSIKGMNNSIIAGEEPEMCHRLKAKGWPIFRLADDMGTHDAAINSFWQWWKRAKRSGFAYAQVYDLHCKGMQKYFKRENFSIMFWACIYPIVVTFLALLTSPVFLLLLSLYLVQTCKVVVQINRRLQNIHKSIAYGFFTMIAKWPQMIGQLIFIKQKLTGQHASIIEHKQK
jgi:glycosyltransferase involved in cell wall biosynthesis